MVCYYNVCFKKVFHDLHILTIIFIETNGFLYLNIIFLLFVGEFYLFSKEITVRLATFVLFMELYYIK